MQEVKKLCIEQRSKEKKYAASEKKIMQRAQEKNMHYEKISAGGEGKNCAASKEDNHAGSEEKMMQLAKKLCSEQKNVASKEKIMQRAKEKIMQREKEKILQRVKNYAGSEEKIMHRAKKLCKSITQIILTSEAC